MLFLASLVLAIHLLWILWVILGAFWTRGRAFLTVAYGVEPLGIEIEFVHNSEQLREILREDCRQSPRRVCIAATKSFLDPNALSSSTDSSAAKGMSLVSVP
jgi:hypothetical protein